MNIPEDKPPIGIAGGMGPEAGLDLHRKILKITRADSDQEHLPVVHLSFSHLIEDRTAFLKDPSRPNPGEAIAAIVLQLAQNGARVAGIPCNSAHAPAIWDCMVMELSAAGSKIKVLHMVEETVTALGRNRTPVGVLATTGTYEAGTYQNHLEAHGWAAVMPNREVQDRLVHPAIYRIKSAAQGIPSEVIGHLEEALDHLRAKGAERVILGCTELPLALPGDRWQNLGLVDPTLCLARALVRATYPDQLLPA